MGRNQKKATKRLSILQTEKIGNYIVDFYCPSAKLPIEIDGGQHYSEDGVRKDKVRDSYLTSLGFRVLRFSDRQVLGNIGGVLDTIREYD